MEGNRYVKSFQYDFVPNRLIGFLLAWKFQQCRVRKQFDEQTRFRCFVLISLHHSPLGRSLRRLV